MAGKARVNWFKENVLKGADAGIYKALRKAGAIVSRAAKAKAPVGTEVRGTATKGKYAGKSFTERTPGTLKKSIRQKVIRKKKKVQIIAGNRDVYYAAFVEFGADEQPAMPYMRPALHANESAVESAFKDQMP